MIDFMYTNMSGILELLFQYDGFKKLNQSMVIWHLPLNTCTKLNLIQNLSPYFSSEYWGQTFACVLQTLCILRYHSPFGSAKFAAL